MSSLLEEFAYEVRVIHIRAPFQDNRNVSGFRCSLANFEAFAKKNSTKCFHGYTQQIPHRKNWKNRTYFWGFFGKSSKNASFFLGARVDGTFFVFWNTFFALTFANFNRFTPFFVRK